MNLFSVISLIGGLTFFLFGMNVMSGSLEKMAGGKLEEMLQRMTSNPIISIALGAVITIAVQSSSATTVMLVGLVNSGIMQFGQTINVIFGANIGTTLTSWILSLSGIQGDNIWLQMAKPENFSPILAFIGILMSMLSKNDRKKSIGTVFVGFSVLMYGMLLMKDAVSPLANMPGFEDLLVKFNNPIVGVLVGTLFTAVIQSSAASIGILQALSLTGSITYGIAIPIVMGQNIGTCATSLISCIGTNVKAKRVAVLHVSIKIIGTIICLSVFCLLNAFFRWSFVGSAVSPVTIALIHSIFNILTTVILMPFSKKLVFITEKLVRDKHIVMEEPQDALFLDERLLRSPSVAVSECFNATKKMSHLARENMYMAMGLVDHYDETNVRVALQTEEELDDCEDKLGTYLVKLSAQALSNQDSQIISKMLHAIGDFERLGDHAVNVVKVAKEIHSKGISFTTGADDEIRILTNAIDEILAITTEAYETNNIDLATQVEPLEQVIDHLISKIKDNHIHRLQRGVCTIEGGFVLSDLLTNYERVSDHCSNIAVAIIEVEHNSFDTHKYLNGVKYGNSEFNEIYERYNAKYSLETIPAITPAPAHL